MAVPASLIATSLLSAVPQAMKIGKGIQQGMAAKKIKPKKRTLSEERERVTKDIATRAAGSKFAGQSQLEERLGQASANVMQKAQRAGSANELLAMGAAEGEKMQNKQLEIAKRALQDKARRESGADEARLSFGQAKEDLAEKERQEQVEQKQQLQEARDKNIYSGVSGIAGIGATMVPGGDRLDIDQKTKNETGDLSTPMSINPGGKYMVKPKNMSDEEWGSFLDRMSVAMKKGM